jgi:hypothetical protein
MWLLAHRSLCRKPAPAKLSSQESSLFTYFCSWLAVYRMIDSPSAMLFSPSVVLASSASKLYGRLCRHLMVTKNMRRAKTHELSQKFARFASLFCLQSRNKSNESLESKWSKLLSTLSDSPAKKSGGIKYVVNLGHLHEPTLWSYHCSKRAHSEVERL